jgi:hypothetical protein
MRGVGEGIRWSSDTTCICVTSQRLSIDITSNKCQLFHNFPADCLQKCHLHDHCAFIKLEVAFDTSKIAMHLGGFSDSLLSHVARNIYVRRQFPFLSFSPKKESEISKIARTHNDDTRRFTEIHSTFALRHDVFERNKNRKWHFRGSSSSSAAGWYARRRNAKWRFRVNVAVNFSLHMCTLLSFSGCRKEESGRDKTIAANIYFLQRENVELVKQQRRWRRKKRRRMHQKCSRENLISRNLWERVSFSNRRRYLDEFHAAQFTNDRRRFQFASRPSISRVLTTKNSFFKLLWRNNVARYQ